MSRTDKTNPYWVQIDRREGNIKPWRIYHAIDCDGWCTPRTPKFAEHRFTTCEIWMRYSDNYKFYGRHPKRATRKAMGRNNAARAELVKLRRQWAQETDREAIDSMWNAPTVRRHLYDPWWWD